MSGSGAPQIDVTGSEGIRVAIIASQWHDTVMSSLVRNAQATCDAAGAVTTLIRVPGSFELGVAALRAARSGKFDVIVALGVIIRGGTPHFEFVSAATMEALNRVALDTGIPIGFGVLTCDDDAQALARAGLPESTENKGREAAEAALALERSLRSLGL